MINRRPNQAYNYGYSNSQVRFNMNLGNLNNTYATTGCGYLWASPVNIKASFNSYNVVAASNRNSEVIWTQDAKYRGATGHVPENNWISYPNTLVEPFNLNNPNESVKLNRFDVSLKTLQSLSDKKIKENISVILEDTVKKLNKQKLLPYSNLKESRFSKEVKSRISINGTNNVPPLKFPEDLPERSQKNFDNSETETCPILEYLNFDKVKEFKLYLKDVFKAFTNRERNYKRYGVYPSDAYANKVDKSNLISPVHLILAMDLIRNMDSASYSNEIMKHNYRIHEILRLMLCNVNINAGSTKLSEDSITEFLSFFTKELSFKFASLTLRAQDYTYVSHLDDAFDCAPGGDATKSATEGDASKAQVRKSNKCLQEIEELRDPYGLESLRKVSHHGRFYPRLAFEAYREEVDRMRNPLFQLGFEINGSSSSLEIEDFSHYGSRFKYYP